MKTKQILPLLALVAGLAFNATAAPHDHAKPDAAAQPAAGRLEEPADKDNAWLAQARAAYPLKTCVMSKEELGGMGEVTDMIYRADGAPDRLVRFCCESCIKDFKKDPAAALKRIDEAAAKAKAAPADKQHH